METFINGLIAYSLCKLIVCFFVLYKLTKTLGVIFVEAPSECVVAKATRKSLRMLKAEKKATFYTSVEHICQEK